MAGRQHRRPTLARLIGARWRSVLLALALTALEPAAGLACPGTSIPGDVDGPGDGRVPSGVVVSEPEASPGFTLFAPLNERRTYLVDSLGHVAHQWEHDTRPGLSVYLLEDGSLLRCGQVIDPQFQGSGHGGVIQRVSWENELLWEYRLADACIQAHHDIEPLPNGNVVAIVWEFHDSQEAIEAGRDPQTLEPGAGFLTGALLEIRPIGARDGEVVWEWHAWDHRVQDRDPDAPHFGPTSSAGRIDLNGGRHLAPERGAATSAGDRLRDADRDPTRDETHRALMAEIEADMRALGYAGGGEEAAPDANPSSSRGPAGRAPRPRRPGRSRPLDWLHLNAVAYSPEHDLLLLSSRTFSEVWIVDHSTTSAEASGSSGGQYGHGGDLLYRWGNRAAYGHGSEQDRTLFLPHDPRWIDGGTAFTVFNNGPGRPGGSFSSVDEIPLPAGPGGEPAFDGPLPHGPPAPRWSYVAPEPESFFGTFLSGAQRLADGGTLVCEGPSGRVFEISADGRLVWEYRHPVPEGSRGTDETIPWVRPDVLPPRPTPPRGTPRHSRRTAMFRATRIPPDHPGLRGRL